DGILVDDPGDPADIVRRVRQVIEVLFPDRAEAVERQVCEHLGVDDLRTWIRNPRGFFEAHVKRYTKSGRKAPIYWLLQSARRNYSLWLYYHQLNRDTVFRVLTEFVEPKLRGEEARLRD